MTLSFWRHIYAHMYLRLSRQKRANGSVLEHYQLAESVWCPQRKRSKTRILYNFGRVSDPAVVAQLRKLAASIMRRCDPEALAAGNPGWKLIQAWPYGDAYVLEALWQRLGIPEVVAQEAASRKLTFPVERALFALVANRVLAPSSKLYAYDRWLRDDVRIAGTEGLELHHLYRAMDFLVDHQEALERAIFERMSDLFNIEVDLVFYDTTSLHFEISEEDEGTGEAPGTPAVVRKRGYAKNGRGDVPQLVVGLAVTRDGLPVRHWIFPGNTVDVTTVEQVKRDLVGWRLSRVVFVGDAGMSSEKNLRLLSQGGGRYIVGVPAYRGGEVSQEVLRRSGRYKEVADNLRVKEVVVGEGERRRRYVVCHNPEEATRQQALRERRLEEIRAELARLQGCTPAVRAKGYARLRTSKRYGKYVRPKGQDDLVLDRQAIERVARRDGKFVITSNDDTLSAEDIALGYKHLRRVEQAWRTLKSGLALRPVFHRTAHRIRAHVALTVLGLLLERVAERALGDTWRNIRDDLKRIQLAQLSTPEGLLWQVTEGTSEARNRLKKLGLKNPPPIYQLG